MTLSVDQPEDRPGGQGLSGVLGDRPGRARTTVGWASSFLRAGAGAFIGSLWEVTDASASGYAQQFHQAALSGNTLGESARQARDAIRGNPMIPPDSHMPSTAILPRGPQRKAELAMRFWRRQRKETGRGYFVRQFELGLHYFRMPTGDRDTNLGKAIAYFTEGLRFFTAEAYPAEYAAAQNNLGVAYGSLLTGDREANLTKAIDCFTEALRFRTAEAGPLDYAATQMNLGNAYTELPRGDRAANVARAIDCYTEALRFVTAEAAPLDYATIQVNLGNAYRELPGGDRAASVARAIDCYTEALRFRTVEAAPLDFAATQINLGGAYQELPGGDRAANLAKAIDCYTDALQFVTAETAPLDYAMAQNNLGNTYAELQGEDRAANLAKAIDCFTEALRIHTAEAAPLAYAMTQNNLSIAYAELLSGDRAANLAMAIGCFTEALRFHTAEAAPLDYAAAQTNLGNAYQQLMAGDRAANVAAAIDCYTEALRFRTAAMTPFDYAMTQISLGLAYIGLPTGDRTANVAMAIDCYTEALRFYTAEGTPLDYARTQHNLGNAYQELLTGDRAANLAKAIDCYTEALRFRTAAMTPFDYAMTQANLGFAYSEHLTGNRAANLARAIDCCTEALRFVTAGAAPVEYALIQNSLGIAYRRLPGGDRAANVTRAIDCCTEALRFVTADAAPIDYAMTQNNLGNAYRELPGGDRALNLAMAIGCYTEALRILSAEATPAECRGTAANLGNLYLEQGRWTEAHTAYSLAIRASELLYQATGSEAGRQAEWGTAGDAVAADAYCLARLGRLAEAAQRLEAGRTRALAEALARDRAALETASEADHTAFVAAADRIKTLEAEGRHGQIVDAPIALDRRLFAKRSTELVQARENLADVIERIRRYLPGFMGEGLGYQDIAAIAQPTRPLVYLLTTSQGCLALLVLAEAQAPSPEHAVWLDSYTSEDVNTLLVRQDPLDQEPSGYLASQLTGDLNQLATVVTDVLEILCRELLEPLSQRLVELATAAATVIPVGRLSLLPLPAAAPEGITIALAPSARALRAASGTARERAGHAAALLGVGNPLPPPTGWSMLNYAGFEVQAIEAIFAAGASQVLSEEAATKTAVRQALPKATHFHLACHGGFDSREPLDSALYLADGDRLTLRDLLDGNLDLSCQRLAVLSACQTGITEFERVPDEVIGLPTGFLQAGIPGVVATLWPVNDRSTAVLMVEFYRLLLVEQKDPATALAMARRWLRDVSAAELAEWFEFRYDASGGTDLMAYEAAVDLRLVPDPADRPYLNPVYWAGFIYLGP
jgi:CHAT domain-containing protein/tetratricopeptide (TPR) repeat protein